MASRFKEIELVGIIRHLRGAEQRNGSAKLALHRLARRHVPASTHIPSVRVAVGPRGQTLREAVRSALVVIARHHQYAVGGQGDKNNH